MKRTRIIGTLFTLVLGCFGAYASAASFKAPTYYYIHATNGCTPSEQFKTCPIDPAGGCLADAGTPGVGNQLYLTDDCDQKLRAQ